jgi:hypothetical protein
VSELLALLLASLRGAVRNRADLVAENLLLRHQLAVLTRPTRRTPRLRLRDRLLRVLARRRRGDRLTPGISVSTRSIRRSRRPPRPPRRTRRTVLRNPTRTTGAAAVVTGQTLPVRTLYVLLLITHRPRATRAGARERHRAPHRRLGVAPAGGAHRPGPPAAAPGAGPGRGLRGDCAGRAQGLGSEAVLTPVRAPRANATAQRVGRTRRHDCLDHRIPLDAAHLRAVRTESVAYANAERPHRTPALQPPVPRAPTSSGPIRGRPVLGGRQHVQARAA